MFGTKIRIESRMLNCIQIWEIVPSPLRARQGSKTTFKTKECDKNEIPKVMKIQKWWKSKNVETPIMLNVHYAECTNVECPWVPGLDFWPDFTGLSKILWQSHLSRPSWLWCAPSFGDSANILKQGRLWLLWMFGWNGNSDGDGDGDGYRIEAESSVVSFKDMAGN